MMDKHGDLIPLSGVSMVAEKSDRFMATGELCPRCSQELTWLFSSLWCPRCHFKEGCCSGEV